MPAKRSPSFPTTHRLSDRLREQVRSYSSGRRPFLILPNGRRSGLVREGVAKPSEHASPERPSSRTRSLLPLGQEAVFDSARGA
ncbi:hypothetical protein B0A93_11980 [Pseudomonas syringae]|nr:hypothetical protein B0A93_11980 [Pseudomonas syringae]